MEKVHSRGLVLRTISGWHCCHLAQWEQASQERGTKTEVDLGDEQWKWRLEASDSFTTSRHMDPEREVRQCIVFCVIGGCFCAGYDLKSLSEVSSSQGPDSPNFSVPRGENEMGPMVSVFDANKPASTKSQSQIFCSVTGADWLQHF